MLSQNESIHSNRHRLEVADIFRLYGQKYRQSHCLSFEQAKVMRHIEICRTAVLGGHIEKCNHCGYEQHAYNSCRNRHCPKCQSLAKEKWLNDRKTELLPCGYFHLVFTLPHEINPIILCNKNLLLDILFQAVNETLRAFARDPNWRLVGKPGFIAVLHTWSQTLMDHFHLHCLIPAGVLSFEKNRWIPARKSFLFKTSSLAKEFRKRYISKLEKAFANNRIIFAGNTAQMGVTEDFTKLIKGLKNKKWIVYAKRPFAGPEQVLEYLGRYTHRVAISNNRIESIVNENVTFSYKDRKDNNKIKQMTLTADEFIRRFLLHVLPKRFMKIRYFGFLFHREKLNNIQLIRSLIGADEHPIEKIKETVAQMMIRLTGVDITLCPHCGIGRMLTIAKIPKGIEMNST